MEEETTTIRIRFKTKARFDKMGTKGDTADTLLTRLMDFYDKRKV